MNIKRIVGQRIIIGGMIETQTYKLVLPADVLEKYDYLETGSAAKVAEAVNPEAFSDIVEVLDEFWLTSRLLLTAGGNRGPIPRTIDRAFEDRGWIEARIDLFKRAYRFRGQNAATVEDDPLGARADKHLISQVYQKGYSVDNVKDRLAVDVEWNPKDGNLDRDFAAYRAWHEEGLIDAAVLIARMQEGTRQLAKRVWDDFLLRHPEYAGEKQPVRYDTSTTANFEKARERVLRGDLGSCPILVVGIGGAAWDGVPWDGRVHRYCKERQSLQLVEAFAPKKTGETSELKHVYEVADF